jgi:hypothetical protein
MHRTDGTFASWEREREMDEDAGHEPEPLPDPDDERRAEVIRRALSTDPHLVADAMLRAGVFDEDAA